MHKSHSCAISVPRYLPAWVILFAAFALPAHALESECDNLKNAPAHQLLTVLRTVDPKLCAMNEEMVAKVKDNLPKATDAYAEYFDAAAFRNLQRDFRANDQESVTYRMLPNARAYVRIHAFNERIPQLVIGALQHLSRDKPLTGLVLDLRDNPGGLVRSAVGVAAAFLPTGALVASMDGEDPASKREMRAHPDDYLSGDEEDFLVGLPAQFKTLPITVLVNRGSASASEILAGALQDHGRAVVVGTKTYGKGTVQTIIPLPDDTAVKFTTAYFHTPKGRRVDGQGVSPDVLIARYARPSTDKSEGLSAVIYSTITMPDSACVLKLEGTTPVALDLSQWTKRDREDCQLQQAMLWLNAQRLAKAR
ncbi:MAG: S41 family peptidase [Burkholderiales bacterium]